ncbi:hypothetical protein [Aeoliella mucimassa]|uniref:PilZ domain-containing protein n=1 Tax=Aeoliella mucimassa TaxID=2527972 RepID=A0A518AHK0_9BACT|nr:hypothetical protein [Aeoliella mucimassa]QDU54211.1 hypothetical protein Pan181_03910 [Aeoliella mucimassa]
MAWIGNTPTGGLTCQVPRMLGSQVAELLKRLQPKVGRERRSTTRHAIPYIFELSPRDELPPELAQSFTVVGKDVCDRGIGFFHQKPIPYRHGMLEIELPDEGIVQLEVDLLWCRFTSFGWYESGGRLLGVTSGLSPACKAG